MVRRFASNAHRAGHLVADLPASQALKEVGSAFDPFGILTSMMQAQFAWVAHPLELSNVLAGLGDDMLALQMHLMRRAMGQPSASVVLPHADDTRFHDPVWEEVPTWDILKESYLAFTHRLEDMLYATPGLTPRDRRRAAFWARKWLNAIAPTNFFLTNPVAQRKWIESNGKSLEQGLRNFLDDLRGGEIRMVDGEPFAVGENLATTLGQVVFRNRLLEVIQYSPQTKEVHRTPLVIVTPWINKFYILDLNARKTLVGHLVKQGFTVFITSWKNPGEEMADVTFDDYLQQGVHAAIECARRICRVKKVNAAGYCIGGTALATYMAWANAHYAPSAVPVAQWTLFTTLVDFAKPGDIEVFIDEVTIDWLTRSMQQQGYLDGKQMASAFRMLRSNSLIWNYFVQNYLYGEAPPPFDVLFWNTDTTRMPAAMHGYYLREMYLHNRLVQPGALTIAGEPIDLGAITQPLYAVGCADDHIAPWKQTFRVSRFINGPVRYVLSSSGHILGVINPPVEPPKRSYQVEMVDRGEEAATWAERTERVAGTWWDDWLPWLAEASGPMQPPPSEHRDYPPLCPAPGTYVIEK